MQQFRSYEGSRFLERERQRQRAKESEYAPLVVQATLKRQEKVIAEQQAEVQADLDRAEIAIAEAQRSAQNIK